MKSKTTVYATLLWVGFALLLAIVPRIFPPDPALPNVASMLGYNIGLAYVLVLGWTAFGVAGIALIAGRKGTAASGGPEIPQIAQPLSQIRRWGERAAVGAGAMLVYWPWSLARFGNYIEDSYFLSVLWKMACGGRPYRDFEFLYGPLMIYPVSAWMKIVGFSTASYYLFYALGQAAFYGLLVAILQHYLPRNRLRYLAFLALLPFVFDALLGLNWIAWRYFSVVFVILLLAARPRSLRTALASGVILGIQTAYSYEYGAATLLAAFAIFSSLLFEPGRKPVLAAAATLTTTAIVVWLGLLAAMTGNDIAGYFQATLQIATAASRDGLGQFAFTWTLHSLALFGLLSCLIVAGGIGLSRLGRQTAGEGDLHLIGALVFLLIALKIGFQRADFLHLAVPFVPLIVVLLINRPIRLLHFGPGLRKTALLLVAVAAVTQAIGQYPLGFGLAERSVRGLKHIVTGRPTVGEIAARNPSVLGERTRPEPRVIAIAERLARADITARPVIFYGGIWERALNSGVCPVGYSFYDILYSDKDAPLADTAKENPGLIVVMRAGDYARLFQAAPRDTSPVQLSAFRRFASLTSSIHWRQSPLENGVEYDMWKAALGDLLVAEFALFDTVADMVLLERSP